MNKVVFPARANLVGFFAFLLLVIAPAGRVHAQVVINEIIANNQSAFQNGDTFPDYVELHNPSGGAVNLAGWSLRDDGTNRYNFPAGSSIAAGGYLLVFFDANLDEPGRHSGFGLSSKGDTVSLFNSGEALVQSIRFGLQAADFSIGRIPNGSGNLVLNVPTPGVTNAAAPLGATTTLKINEWLASPLSGDDWFELYNPDLLPVAIEGLHFTDRLNLGAGLTNRAIPSFSFIAGNEFLQFFANDLDNGDADEVDFRLGASGDRILLVAANRTTVIDQVDFGQQLQNVSEGRLPDGEPGTTYVAFPVARFTPAASNFLPLTNVVINEALPHTDPPLEDAIELYNPMIIPVDISHWWISNEQNDPKKFRIPNGTVLAAGGHKVFYEADFNPDFTGEDRSFTLNSARGDEVFLFTGDGTGKLTGLRRSIDFGPSQNGISFGRYLTSVGVDVVPMVRRTFGMDSPSTQVQFRQGTGLTNATPLIGPVVINEIHFHPPSLPGESNTVDDVINEFVELYNLLSVPLPLFDPFHPANTYHLDDGVEFDFPPGQTMAPGEYLLVVNFDPVLDTAQRDAFRSAFNVPAGTRLYGPYKGKLSNASAAVEVLRPDEPQTRPPDVGLVPYLFVDRVKYSDRAPWPTNADGTGLSLQKIASASYGNEPLNWKVEPPSAGRFNSTNVAVPPMIITQPESQLAVPGESVTFGIVVTGSDPMAFQWRKAKTTLAGQTGSTLVLTNVAARDAGDYSVRVSNGGGAVTSMVAKLTVDAVLPMIAITAPAANARLFTPMTNVIGTARDVSGVSNVFYEFNHAGAFSLATGTTNWTVPVSLRAGTNTIRVKSLDYAGNTSAPMSRSFFLVVSNTLTVQTNGSGTITPVLNGKGLEIGRGYTLTAAPRPGNVFSNWTGSLTSTVAKLSFLMETGMMLAANFVPNPFLPVKGNYTGLFYDTNNVLHESSGLFTATITDLGGYTAKLTTGTKALTVRGQLDLNGRAVTNVARAGTNALQIELQLHLDDGSGLLEGTITSGAHWQATLMADRASFHTTTNKAPWAGFYTLAIPGWPDMADLLPGGDGFGSVTVKPDGSSKFAGTMGEGSAATVGTPFSRDGKWPFYASLYSGKGSIFGWLNIDTNTATNEFSGTLNWFKPVINTARQLYPAGFNTNTSAFGARYVPPVGTTNRAVAITNGILTFVAGNLGGPLTNAVGITANNKVTNGGPLTVTATITAAKASLTGSITPTNAKPVKFNAILIQSENAGYGFYLGTNQSGRVRLETAPPE